MERSDRAKVIGWAESEKHHLEAALQGRKAGSAAQEEGFVARDLALGRADGRRSIRGVHMEPPAYMDDFFLPVISDTAELLPRVALATQIGVDRHGARVAAEHFFQ